MSEDTPHVFYEEVDVTPAMAREWLDRYNTHNRNLRPRHVNSLATDMAAGKWTFTGEPIRFGLDGKLQDGQHRLAAVVKANVTIRFLVIRNLPPEAQLNVDTGAKRKFSDVLKLRGEKQPDTLASVTRKVWLWENGVRRFSGAMPIATNTQLLEVLRKYPQLPDIALKAKRIADGSRLRASIVGLGMWLFEALDEEDSNFFFERLADGQQLEKGNPIYELRRVLTESTQTIRGERHDGTYITALMIKAWNFYRKGIQVSFLRFSLGGSKPERFPEPE